MVSSGVTSAGLLLLPAIHANIQNKSTGIGRGQVFLPVGKDVNSGRGCMSAAEMLLGR